MLTRLLAAFVIGFSLSVCAQDLPKTQFKVIGLNSPTVASIIDEVPFWRETLPKASNGAISADITPLDQMGIDDKTMLRLLRLGVMDFAGMDISKMAGDDPRFEGCDLAGITLDADKARAGCEAYRSVIDRQMQKNWNARLLAFGRNPPPVFWCRGVLGGLGDLHGKKVRVFNNTMRDFLGGIGATAVSMAFAEVVPALNNGVVDCGVTGSLSGNTAGWPEVTKSLYPMSLGWSINVMAVNLTSWSRLDRRVQHFRLDRRRRRARRLRARPRHRVVARRGAARPRSHPHRFALRAAAALAASLPGFRRTRALHRVLRPDRAARLERGAAVLGVGIAQPVGARHADRDPAVAVASGPRAVLRRRPGASCPCGNSHCAPQRVGSRAGDQYPLCR